MTTRTVHEIISWFLRHDVRLKDASARKERARVLGLFCAWRNADGLTIGDLPTDKVIGADLVEFVAAQGEQATWTRKRWIATVKRPFNLAAKLGLISGSPFAGVSAPKGRRGRDLTPEEFRTILRHGTPAFRRAIVFLRFSGARPGELRKLQWPHIRELAKAIVQSEHKTADSTGIPRRIQLNSVLLKLLSWLRRHNPKGSPYVFLNARGRPWTTRRIDANLAKIREKAGLPVDVKIYGARHMYATAAILNGVDIATLAELLGHSGTQMTSYYLHLAGKSDYLQAAAERAVKGCYRKS